MYDALFVRRFQRVRDLPGDGESFLDRNSSRSDPGRQRRTLHKLHDQVIRPDVVQSANVRMIQRGDGARLPIEAVAELRFGDLDRYGAVQARIAGLVDFAHATRPQRLQDLVRTEFSTAIHDDKTDL